CRNIALSTTAQLLVDSLVLRDQTVDGLHRLTHGGPGHRRGLGSKCHQMLFELMSRIDEIRERGAPAIAFDGVRVAEYGVNVGYRQLAFGQLLPEHPVLCRETRQRAETLGDPL